MDVPGWLTAMLTVIAGVLVAGIPWAMAIERKISRIDESLRNSITRWDGHSDKLKDLDSRVDAHEVRIDRLERKA